MRKPATLRRGRWIADRDGIAHAYEHPERASALCGKRPFPEKFGQPRTQKCPSCLRELESPIRP